MPYLSNVISRTLLGSQKDGRSTLFRSFRRQLMHESLKIILDPLQEYMSKFDIVKCPDGHYRRAVYVLGPYIADYPEQVILAGVVNGWCVRCVSFPTCWLRCLTCKISVVLLHRPTWTLQIRCSGSPSTLRPAGLHMTPRRYGSSMGLLMM